MLQEVSNVLKGAADLARFGWAVFPVHGIGQDGCCTCQKPDCGNPGKHPMTSNGFHDAVREVAKVEMLFADQPHANLGVATGKASGIWVLDEDGPEGIQALAQLEQMYGALPETVTTTTGRADGGRHRFFRYPGDREVKNKSKLSIPGAGKSPIDVRGEGGYVIVPPSRHASGKTYTWERSPQDAPIALAPPWLLDLVTEPSGGSPESRIVMPSRVPDFSLACAPGSPEGERHASALALIGAELGRGVHPIEVTQRALAWAARCTPPMPENEIRRIVEDLAQKEAAKTVDVRQEVEAIPLPLPAAHPVLHDAAFYGLAGNIVKTIEPESEADPAGILLQLLVSFGSMVGRRPYFVVEGTRHYPNLFAVLVGSTARGRKGTSEGRVRQILEAADRQWALDQIRSGLASGEGVVWFVRDPIYKQEPIKDKGSVIDYQEVLADPGVEDKRLLVIESEFASVLSVCRRETNTLSPTLRSAWDSGNLRTMAKNSPVQATDAHISIIGHITREELRRALAEVDGFNGFANRFLWASVRRSKLLPEGGQDLDLTEQARLMTNVVSKARSIERMQRDQEAKRLWQEVYSTLANQQNQGLLGAATSRAEAQVLRLSMVYALLDGSAIVSVPHLSAAMAIWDYCYESAKLIFGDSTGNALADKVLQAIRTRPGITRWELHESICKGKQSERFLATLAQLRDAGLIRNEPRPTSGRPAEAWFPTNDTLFTLTSLISLSSRYPKTPTDRLSPLNSLSSEVPQGSVASIAPSCGEIAGPAGCRSSLNSLPSCGPQVAGGPGDSPATPRCSASAAQANCHTSESPVEMEQFKL